MNEPYVRSWPGPRVGSSGSRSARCECHSVCIEAVISATAFGSIGNAPTVMINIISREQRRLLLRSRPCNICEWDSAVRESALQARERRLEALVFVDEEVELVNDDAVQAVLLVQLVDKGGEGMGFGALWGDEDDRVPRRGVVNVPDFGAQVETPVAGQEVLLECDIRYHHDGRPELGDGEGELEQQGLATGGGKHGYDRLMPGL